jgi:hypothetical protein
MLTAAHLTRSMQVKRGPPQEFLQGGNHENRWRQKCELYEETSLCRKFGVCCTVGACGTDRWTLSIQEHHPLAKKTADNFRAQKIGELLGLPGGPPIRTAANVHIPPTRLVNDNYETATCSESRAMGLVTFRRSRKISKSYY